MSTTKYAVRTVVQNASVKFVSPGVMWQEIFPRLPLKTRQEKIWQYNKGDLFRIPDDNQILRAEGAPAWAWKSKGEYVNVDTKEKAVKTSVTDEMLENEGFQPGSMPPVDAAMDAVEQNAALIDRWTDKKVGDTIFAGTWADGTAGGEDAAGLWAPTGSTNTALPDVNTAKDAMRLLGVPVEDLRLAMDYKTYIGLKRVDEIRDQLKYTQKTQPTDLTPSLIAGAFDVSKVVVCASVYSSANEKQDGSDFTGADVWTGGTASKGWAFLYYYPRQIKRKMLAAGVVPTLPLGPGKQTRRSSQWYDPDTHQRWYETQESNEAKIISANCGYLWKETHTAVT